MKIPIILIPTKGKAKKQLVKEFMEVWKKFFVAKKKVEKPEQIPEVKSSGKPLENTKSEFVNNFLKGKSYQIMGQSKPKEKLLPKGKLSEEKHKKQFLQEVKELNRLSRENPRPLIDWLEDSEQIPEEGESVDEFIKRTNWTLEEENKWRKIDGLTLLKSKEEYRKLFREKN